MRKHRILYNWPIDELQRLADSETADAYYEQLTDKKDDFMKIAEELSAFREMLGSKKGPPSDLLPEPEWDNLSKCLELFEREFSDFPNQSCRKLRLFCLIAKKLTAPNPDLDEEEINDELFEYRVMDPPLPLIWFSRENQAQIEDSISIATLSEFAPSSDETPSPLQLELEADNLSPELIFTLLGALAKADFDETKQVYSIKKINPELSTEAGVSFARLSVLTSGAPIHKPRLFPHELSVIDPDLIRGENAYYQLKDVIDVVSEYNQRSDTLAKYLTLYHVFENFMFKMPLVALERSRGGSMFSIRDFRRLYREIDRKEIDVLKKLFEAIFTIEPRAGTIPTETFKDRVAAKWASFCPVPEQPNLDAFLERIGFQTSSGNNITHAMFSSNPNAGHFAQLVYSLRNVIVHNTETELHLSSANFDSSCQLLLEEFLMPTLEEICFHMLSTPNDHVWYSTRKISLY